MTATTQTTAIQEFRKLHESGCFILPNPWDIGSALYLQHLGFKALATTSAGFAFTLGRPDAVAAVSLETALAHFQQIAEATPLPVNADFQNGYADDPKGVATNVKRCIESGVAGLSIEDATGNPAQPLYESELAIDRIRAARSAIDASDLPVVLTARCEAWLVGAENPLDVAINRLIAFAEAGADCLYAPGVRDLKEIEQIVKAVAPKPVNILVGSPSPDLTLTNLSAIGVRRISVGGALARVAWGAFMRASQSIAETGTFDALSTAVPSTEIIKAF
ncbi:MAG: isocitrate lyase/phosphoenolpyruvate mutase family protein [Fimbriimonadaceae bacterium]|nr:isocitrate lyase/phosphoenolpyruvate mutase family protein [Fimbriimonadaceae bacterium]